MSEKSVEDHLNKLVQGQMDTITELREEINLLRTLILQPDLQEVRRNLWEDTFRAHMDCRDAVAAKHADAALAEYDNRWLV